ncbi:MAG TPA: mycofactocin precursor MftA [Acidimicrobiales bacterium]
MNSEIRQGQEAIDQAEQAGADGDEVLVDDELVVEEISIDGMCGVY